MIERQKVEFEKRLRGGVYGLLVGDALGVPYEFHRPVDIPMMSDIEMIPPADFKRSWKHIKPGTWSDDGAQALILLENLVENGTLDYGLFVEKLIDWKDSGYWAVDQFRFDIGGQTNHALTALQHGVVDPEMHGERSNGNGSLMRSLPIALYFTDPALVMTQASQQSMPTHGHELSRVTCQLYCLMAYHLVQGAQKIDAYEDAVRMMLAHDEEIGATNIWLDKLLVSENNEHTGSGYVLDSFWTAVQCLWTTDSYERCVKKAIMYGNDTDTTACIAGGLAGIYYGVDAIPKRWIEALRDREKVEVLVNKLIEVRK